MWVSPLVFVLLVCAIHTVSFAKAHPGDNLDRKRREWILPPKPLTENKDYTSEEYVARIRSDFATHGEIAYSLEGPGANQPPYHVFIVDSQTGLIRVTQKLDREKIDMYTLLGVAKYRHNQTEAEKKIEIRIKVVDENDNPPVFENIFHGQVDELSPIGTSVMTVNATDADEPGNINSIIAYSIINQKPSDMFDITKDGKIFVKKPGLDREGTPQYTLTLQAQDLYGNPKGNTATGTFTIEIRDVNDHPPTLEKEEYEGSIEENKYGVEVMRLKAEDLDVKNTDNWKAEFDIVKGNEAGYFSIRTDPVTNEGILMLDKAVDYEDVKNLDLGIAVRNKAPLHDGTNPATIAGIGLGATGAAAGGGGGASGAAAGGGGGATGAAAGGGGGGSGTTYKTYPVKINVKNQPEGPAFDPKVKAIHISEGDNSIKINDVIAHYPAIDGDTRELAENVRYAKGSDPDNWFTIDPQTAEIKLNKMPDRESKYLENGTYYAKVLCMTKDMPSKTATGTIAIQVQDSNDHCPELTSHIQTMCITDTSVIVSAEDADVPPNGPPFHFVIIPEGSQGKWKVERLNDTAAILRAQESMWPGSYEVELRVSDQQDHACPDPQKVKVQVCTCEDGVQCGERGSSGQISKGAELGPAGIGLLMLGLLLLLLIPLLLLFCRCGGEDFRQMPSDTKSHLINYHTEGQGENTDVPLLTMPTQVDGDIKINKIGLGMLNQTSAMATMASLHQSVMSMDGMNRGVFHEGFGYGEHKWGMNEEINGTFHSEGRSAVGGGIFDGMALPDHILAQYYTQKMNSENDNLGVKDGLLVYDYEGQGSSAGSVGCCSLLESDNDLQFLDDLGPKFKTLSEVCGGKKIQTEVKSVSSPVPPSTINSQTSVSRVVTSQQLPPPPQPQPTVSKTEQTVIRETSERSQVMKEGTATLRQGMTTVKGGVANQGQMFLVQQQQQQPVYYTTTPVMQPVQYVVQPQVQNTMLLAEAPASNLQGVVLVNNPQVGPAQGLVVQGQTVMSSGHVQGPSMMLVEGSGVQGGIASLSHTGNRSGTQTMMVMEGKVPAGSMKVLKGSQASLVQGGLSGSQRVLVVGGPDNTGQLIQGAEGQSQRNGLSSSQRVLYSNSSMSVGSQSSMMGSSTVSTNPTHHKVVVQETRDIH